MGSVEFIAKKSTNKVIVWYIARIVNSYSLTIFESKLIVLSSPQIPLR